MTFGTVLQEAREQKGFDLFAAARRLRIRPDILRSIEEEDFAGMPPRGNTRNMVNAYARFLGLNPTEITRMYLDEVYAYQVGRARTDARSNGFDMGNASRTRNSRSHHPAPHEKPETRAPQQNAFGRTLYDDRTPYTRSDYGHGPASTGGTRLYSEDRTHASRHPVLPSAQYTNFYAGPKAPSGIRSKLPLIIAVVVILILLILVFMLLFGNKGAAEEELPAVPVTGIDDTTQGDAPEEPVAPPAPVIPTSAKVVYEVASGQSAYIEVYENDGGATVASTIDGPSTKEFDVTGTLRFVTTNPVAVTFTVDGAIVEPVDKAGVGVYSYTVDFPAILEQWQADHPAAGAGATGAADTGTTGSGATNTSAPPAA